MGRRHNTHRHKWSIPDHWLNSLPNVLKTILRPNSDISRELPELHKAMTICWQYAWAQADKMPISRCSHSVNGLVNFGRTDDGLFQTLENISFLEIFDPAQFDDSTATRFKYMCKSLKERMHVYGILGEGSKYSSSLSP